MIRTVTLAALAALAASACQACHDDHPYVPYTIGLLDSKSSAPPSGVEPAPSGMAEEGGAAFAQQAATLAPPDSKAWTLDGLALAAPEGTVFQLGLARDLDGDGAVDALAIVRGKNPGDQAQVLFYAGGAGGAVPLQGVLAAAPPPMPSDPSCSPLQRLSQVGPHSAFVEVGWQCAGHAEARAHAPVLPTRWAAVVWAPPKAKRPGTASAAPTATVHFAWLIADPPSAPTLTLDADGSDYDGDGIDDVTLRVTLEGGGPPFEPGPRVGATVRWIDRPAGMSREPDQPEASLHTLSSQAASRAKGKDAATVPILVHQARALYQAICSEGGAARITRAPEGRPLSCGASSRALEELGLAETRALLTTGDVPGAIKAFDRAQQPPAAHTTARTADAQGWIVQSAAVSLATSLRAINAIPLIDHGRAPSWGAMAFEPSGKVLVRTPGPVVRVDPAQGDEAEASDVPTWKAGVLSPDGAVRWMDVIDPCDGSALRAIFAGGGSERETGEREVLLPIAGRLGAHCPVGKGEPAPATPVAWGQPGLVVLVAGQPLAFAVDLSRASLQTGAPAQPTTPGAPRSPDGKTLVIPTSQGILVQGARTRLYRARELDGAYLELRDCTVSDDATRVACVRGGRAFVGIW